MHASVDPRWSAAGHSSRGRPRHHTIGEAMPQRRAPERDGVRAGPTRSATRWTSAASGERARRHTPREPDQPRAFDDDQHHAARGPQHREPAPCRGSRWAAKDLPAPATLSMAGATAIAASSIASAGRCPSSVRAIATGGAPSAASRAASPNGSGAVHGQTTSGGVTNFTSTSSQSAWRATGPMSGGAADQRRPRPRAGP